MRQVVITEAENGFVVEVRENGNNEVLVATNAAKVVKLVKEALKEEEPADPPF